MMAYGQKKSETFVLALSVMTSLFHACNAFVKAAGEKVWGGIRPAYSPSRSTLILASCLRFSTLWQILDENHSNFHTKMPPGMARNN
jgi:hypothetical protein